MASSQHALGCAAPAPCVSRYFPRPPHPSQGLSQSLVPMYVQPPPPCLSFQWPLPMAVPYNAHFGLPAVGYGMAMFPVPLVPYMESPAYVAPPSQFPLGDYMRMVTPHSLPMSFHGQRFRHQPNPPSRMTVSAAVQTLSPDSPLSRPQIPGAVKSDSGRGSIRTTSSTTSSPTSSLLGVEEQGDLGNKLTDMAQRTGGLNCDMSPEGSMGAGTVVQGISPLAKQSACGDGVQCHCSPAGGTLLTPKSPAHTSSLCPDAEIRVEQHAPSYPCALRGEGSPSVSSSTMICFVRGSSHSGKETAEVAAAHFDMSSVWPRAESSEDEDLSAAEDTDTRSKIVKLPFDCRYVAGWRRMDEQSVWSVESVPKFQPSTNWLAEHRLLPSHGASESGADAATCLKRRLDDDPEDVVTASDRYRRAFHSSSMDSLPAFVPTGDWLSELGKMFPSGRVHLCAQVHQCVPVDKFGLVAEKPSPALPPTKQP